MASKDQDQSADQAAQRTSAERKQDRETAKRDVSAKNERAHKAQVARRKEYDRFKASLRDGLEF